MERAVVVSLKIGQGRSRKLGFCHLVDDQGQHLPGADLLFHFNENCGVRVREGGPRFDHRKRSQAPKVGDILVIDRKGWGKGKAGVWTLESDWLAAGGTV